MTGKDFPATTDAFDARIPKSAFKRLDVVDPNVYNETRDSLTKIGSTCNRFYDNDLHRLGKKTSPIPELRNLDHVFTPFVFLSVFLSLISPCSICLSETETDST